MRSAAAALIACVALVVAAPAGGSARATLPARFFSVWLPYWEIGAAGASALGHAAEIATASPFWYTVSARGGVTANLSAGDSRLVAALRARGVAVVPTVTESAGMVAFDRMLASTGERAALVRALVGIARQPGYTGLDLDFEQFALDPKRSLAAADAAAAGYPRLLADVCVALHAIRRTCTVTVMPRTTAARRIWRGRLATWVYNYAALGAVADRVRIMAYDDHTPSGAPGPVAPYAWVAQVVSFARSQFPARKAELGLAAYGYTWGPGGNGPFTDAEAGRLAATHHTRARWSALAGEEEFSYGPRRHRTTGWYEDARAELMRARLAAAAGFAGVSLWAAGYETPALWSGAASLAAGRG